MRRIELCIVTRVVNLLNVDAFKTKEINFCIALLRKWPLRFRLRRGERGAEIHALSPTQFWDVF